MPDLLVVVSVLVSVVVPSGLVVTVVSVESVESVEIVEPVEFVEIVEPL